VGVGGAGLGTVADRVNGGGQHADVDIDGTRWLSSIWRA
jgi:hypothetical protein